MPIIGPNCYGLINYADGALLWPDQHGGVRLAADTRGVGIITQSSNIACNLTMQKRGLPVAFLMTAGNQAQTGLSEMALGLIEDDRVSALGLHIEGFDSVGGFERLASRARELRKPIVAMKVGRSEQARAATISHTASLAGSDAASDAFLKRLGIARVDSIPSFLESLMLLHAVGPLSGRRLSSMSCSGGEASVMADSVEGRQVRFPPLTEAHRASVKATLGPLVAVANPLDYHTFIWNNQPAMTATFTAMVSGGFDLNMLVLDFPRNDRCSDADWWPTVNAFESALNTNKARGAVVASMLENLPEQQAAELSRRGIVPLHGIAEAMDAAEAAACIGEAWARPVSAPLVGEVSPQGGWRRGARFSNSRTAARPRRGRGQGIACESRPAGSSGAPRRQCGRSGRCGVGARLPRRAEGARHRAQVRARGGAARSARRSGRPRRRGALSGLGTGLYVERMVTGGVAELIVGITSDPIFGPVMTIGSGGVLVELLKDSATLLLPATRADIEAALRGLKLFPLLDGFRGRPKADLGAAVDAIRALPISQWRMRGAIEELDINPLIVCAEGQGAWIADALLVIREAAAIPSLHRQAGAHLPAQSFG